MFKIFKRLSKTDYLLILLNVFLVAGSVALELKIPDYMTEITQIIGRSGEFGAIIVCGLKMLLCAVLSALLTVMVGLVSARLSASIGYSLRADVFGCVQNFSKEDINKFSSSSLITRTTNDITQVQMFFSMAFQLAVKSPIMAVLAIVKILNRSWQWSIATAVAIFIITIVLCLVIFLALPKFKKIQKLNDYLNRVSRENLTGVRVVRAFNAESYQEEKFNNVNEELTSSHLFTNKVMSLINPTMNFIMSALPLSIYVIGAILISNEMLFDVKLDVFSNMIVVSSYAIQVVMSFVMLVFIFMMMPRAAVSAERINEVLDTKVKIVDGSGAENRTNGEQIKFNNVSFKYPDAEEYILENISFSVKKGQTVAFIGSTGSGKSTLINLIARIYDPTEGSVFLDGANLKDYKIKEIYNKIGYIAQTPSIFSGTVRSNIALGDVNGNKPAEEDIKRAIQIAQANFVYDKQDGLDAVVNQGGKNLSGGQKQRIAIARAIARKPEILIFDDSFSALDYKTDKALRNAIKKELKGTTCLIVAQRIGTIKDADRIIVLNDGKVVGDGTHEHLLKECSVYKEIALSQLSKEEL